MRDKIAQSIPRLLQNIKKDGGGGGTSAPTSFS